MMGEKKSEGGWEARADLNSGEVGGRQVNTK